MELIKISDYNGKKAVNARELHFFLEVETRYNDWIKRMLEYGFVENVDYSKMSIDNQLNIYALTLECAKEISMLQRSEKGKMARQYFIECEKKLLQPREFSRKELAQMIIEAETAKELAESKVKELAPKATVYDQISNSNDLVNLNDAAKILGLGRNTMMKKLRENKVLMRNNTPYQNYIDVKLFEVKMKPFKIGDVENLYPQTFVTGKGMNWLASHKEELK